MVFDNYINPQTVVQKEGANMELDIPESSEHDKRTAKGDGFDEYVQNSMKAPVYEP